MLHLREGTAPDRIVGPGPAPKLDPRPSTPRSSVLGRLHHELGREYRLLESSLGLFHSRNASKRSCSHSIEAAYKGRGQALSKSRLSRLVGSRFHRKGLLQSTGDSSMAIGCSCIWRYGVRTASSASVPCRAWCALHVAL